jgi:hypothetical protein
MEIVDKVEQTTQIVYSRDWACPCPCGRPREGQRGRDAGEVGGVQTITFAKEQVG